MKVLAAALAVIATQVGPISPCYSQTVDWEVLDRFRVFKRHQHERYREGIAAIFEKARSGTRRYNAYRALIEPGDGAVGWAVDIQTEWSEKENQYNRHWVHDPKRLVRVSLSSVPTRSTCAWSLQCSRDAGGACSASMPAHNSCTPLTIPVSIGESIRGEVVVTPSQGGSKNLPLNISVKDVLVAVIGDSVGSGEGNPHLTIEVDRFPAIWWDTRCHRSLMSGSAQAAIRLAESDTKRSLTFLSYACSGAEINDGIRTGYSGRETTRQIEDFLSIYKQAGYLVPTLIDPADNRRPADFKLESQLDKLEEALCAPPAAGRCTESAKRRPDILIVAVGGNDIGFGEIGRYLLLKNPGRDKAKWRSEQQRKLKPMFDTLSEHFELLAKDTKDRIGARSTLLLEYLNLTRNERNQLCGTPKQGFESHLQKERQNFYRSDARGDGPGFSLYNLLLVREEAVLAEWIVKELNKTIRAAAPKFASNETSVAIVPLQDLKGPRGEGRGLCAVPTWIISLGESWKRQDWLTPDTTLAHRTKLKLTPKQECPYELIDGECKAIPGGITTGILHPNFFGHYNMSIVIADRMKRALAAQ